MSVYSPAQLAQRAAALPVVTYPDLPVSDHRGEIAQAIKDHQVVIVAGETGSGKTTQLPKICLQLGRGIAGMIGHTQPRRIAARSVADRIAAELGQTVGKTPGQVIGYQVRFTDEVGPTTLVKLMTDGILLNEIQTDPKLSKYDTIIVDEAHERSLNIDFILGYLARLVGERPDLKVIITSATIDSEKFASHFSKVTGQRVPVIEVSGRTYPVEVRYRPLSPETDEGDLDQVGYGLGQEIDLDQGLSEAVDELLDEPDGDILVFLPGERDIREAQKNLERHVGPRHIEIVPLFARLSNAEQQRIFASHTRRRIILSTNIAETSLTVPGIRYVIDAGLARISRFSNKTKVQRLPIEPVSQASANQRSGRAGRLSNGIAIRLYSAPDFESRDEYTDPEILRTSLASVILQMNALGLGEVADFPFIDAPSRQAVRDGVALLVEIGALTDDGRLTKIGRKLARLPIDPRLGRMLLAGDKLGCASEILVIIAALSIQDVRERPLDNQEAADLAHSRFADERSDFLTYLNLWRYLNVSSRDLSGSAFRRMCRNEFLHYLRYREWRDVVTQLRQMCQQISIKVEPLGVPSRNEVRQFAEVSEAVVDWGKSVRSVDYDQVHRALLTGLLSNVGNWDQLRGNYVGARGTRFTIWPGSGLSGRHPDWVMAAELVETSRLFARTVAHIKSEWIEEQAPHLVRYTYAEPYWSRSKGAAFIKEKVILYGLTLVASRPVLLGKLGLRTIGTEKTAAHAVARPGTIAAIAQGLTAAPSGAWSSGQVDSEEVTAGELAREMFIRHALVGGEWRGEHLAFVRHNRETVAEAEEIARRSRQGGILADEDDLYRFFDDRLPENIVSSRHFESWWKKERTRHPHLLDLQLSDVLAVEESPDLSGFPDVWHQGDFDLPIRYDFQPGAASDGITITIPLTVLSRLKDEGFDWLVPGLLPELCTETIKGLPKVKRRQLSPAPDTGEAIAARLRSDEPFVDPAKLSSAGSANSGSATAGMGADDPRSLASSLERLSAWGAKTGQVRGKGNPLPATETTTSTPASTSEEPHRGEPSGDFADSFKRAVAEIRGVNLEPEEIAHSLDQLPRHLHINFVVVDEAGKELGRSTSLTHLQRRLDQRAGKAITQAVRQAVTQAATETPLEKTPGDWEKSQVTDFPATIARRIETRDKAGLVVRGYPALIDNGPHGVELRPLGTPDQARAEHVRGVSRLLARELRLSTARITTRWSGREALLLAASPYPTTEALVDDAQYAAALALVERLCTELPFERKEFAELTAQARDLFEEEVYQILRTVVRTLEAQSELQAQIKADNPAVRDVKRQMNSLVYDGYLSETPRRYLDYLPRYLRAGALRLQRAGQGRLDQDQIKMTQIRGLEEQLRGAEETLARRPFSLTTARELERVRWLLQELRVSLFAEQLGTSEKVSPPRLSRAIQSLLS